VSGAELSVIDAKMHEELCALAEELLEIAHDNVPLNANGNFDFALRTADQLHARARSMKNGTALTLCIGNVRAQMSAGLGCGELSNACTHLKGARDMLGKIIQTLEGM
jgi:hypothetical protein